MVVLYSGNTIVFTDGPGSEVRRSDTDPIIMVGDYNIARCFE